MTMQRWLCSIMVCLAQGVIQTAQKSVAEAAEQMATVVCERQSREIGDLFTSPNVPLYVPNHQYKGVRKSLELAGTSASADTLSLYDDYNDTRIDLVAVTQQEYQAERERYKREWSAWALGVEQRAEWCATKISYEDRCKKASKLGAVASGLGLAGAGWAGYAIWKRSTDVSYDLRMFAIPVVAWAAAFWMHKHGDELEDKLLEHKKKEPKAVNKPAEPAIIAIDTAQLDPNMAAQFANDKDGKSLVAGKKTWYVKRQDVQIGAQAAFCLNQKVHYVPAYYDQDSHYDAATVGNQYLLGWLNKKATPQGATETISSFKNMRPLGAVLVDTSEVSNTSHGFMQDIVARNMFTTPNGKKICFELPEDGPDRDYVLLCYQQASQLSPPVAVGKPSSGKVSLEEEEEEASGEADEEGDEESDEEDE